MSSSPCKFAHSRYKVELSRLIPSTSSSFPPPPSILIMTMQHKAKRQYLVEGESSHCVFDEKKVFTSAKTVLVDKKSDSGALYSAVVKGLEAIGVRGEKQRAVTKRVESEARKMLLGGDERSSRRNIVGEVSLSNEVLIVDVVSIDCFVCCEEVASNFDDDEDQITIYS